MDMREPDVIYETEELGTVSSRVAPGYAGPCRMTYSGSGRPRSDVFPTFEQARAAAVFAVGVLGGYLAAELSEAPGVPWTFEKWEDWAFLT